ncbi:hypothetical protein [Wenjunlia tyrosinilytica]|uniref:Cytochrome C oxidase subunit I n=1 Tax=Wenjunlia tyrosinilytica TaxID=1544741 RepID=A0A917ZXM7_9ACTN|nr:hypothetical protein [Wenjunlia tyrosinilytica]GGO99830.1 hypothetical protein GCM10012280_67160 [Wenjunlia tyrosinilytica]
MTETDARHPRAIAAGVNEIEGYLLWQAQVARARAGARDFSARLPWLTTAQRMEVERVHYEDQLVNAQAAVKAVAERCREVRKEYEEVYRNLRRRLATAFALGTCVVLTLALLVAR